MATFDDRERAYETKFAHDADLRFKRARARWGDHGRPTMRVDFDGYMHELGVEIDSGRERAQDGSAT